MSSIITLDFEHYKAQEAATGTPVILDEFVFALVPNLDPKKPIERTEQLPNEKYIVHRQTVNKSGLVSENAVAYSVTLGTEIGDFEFNWIGLLNKASNSVAMITHAPTQKKLRTQGGQQGNVLTRSFLLEFDGAAKDTAINTTAETWQIDFTARLSGIDEMQRLINVDSYGSAAFFNDGFEVTRSSEQYTVKKGLGYVGGLRGELAQNQILNGLRNTKVYADFSYQGNIVSQWNTVIKITAAATLNNYVDAAGFSHQVFAIASIDANGNVKDLRSMGALSSQEISALEMRLKLDLNKKIDKANISGQKGNDNDKVPSLNLMTNELGILSTQNKNLSERITSAQNTANQANKAASSAQKDAASANDNAELRALKTTKVNGYPLTNNVFLTTKDIFKNMTDLGSDNLSTIFSPGIYYQKTNASALWSRNYPKDGVGGVLIVYRTNQGATITNNACVQVYYSNENITYTRVYNGSSWVGGWASQLNTANTTVDRNGYLKVSNSSAVSDCPVGAPIPWPQSTAPSGFLVCNGQAFNKTTYPLLAAAYPSGVLPDLRAEFIRGLDAGRNIDSERVVLSEQSDAIRNITGSMKFSEMIGGIPSDGAFYVSSNPSVPKTFHSSGRGTSPTISFDPSRVVPTANENRPRNIAFLYIVRAA
ncbi:phage tail protein [Moellerella wisconsensis]|uniref:phage tail-collar fiber domain-containing protein n=1 Tax=Moellerella wisconsensis TaxID=158849 RepID=UPI0030760D17